MTAMSAMELIEKDLAEELAEASRGLAMLCSPGIIEHGVLAGAPTVDARVLRGGILRTTKIILVDIWALLNQSRTRLVNFIDLDSVSAEQMAIVTDVVAELRRANIRCTAEVSGQCDPGILGAFDRAFDVVRVAIVPDLRVARLPNVATLDAAQEIRALVRTEGDLTTLASILESMPVHASRHAVLLELALSTYPAEARALYELARTVAFKHGWRLSPYAPQPKRAF